MNREQLRQAMPTVAEIVDELRPWLRRVVFCSENGHVIDRREPVNPDAVFDIPEGYRRPVATKESR